MVFVQVSTPHPTEAGERKMLDWVSAEEGELTTAAEAIEIAKTYVDLPVTLGATLETDRMKTLGRANGPAQIAGRRFGRDNLL